MFDPLVDRLPESWRNDEATFYGLVIAILLVLFTIVIFRFSTKSSRSGRKVLIMGLSDSGKTLLFSQLIGKKHVTTLTSMKMNEAPISLNKKTLYLVDIPGFERLRNKCFEDSKIGILSIIFVIDSSLFTTNIRDIADYLYSILTDYTVCSKRIPIAIACNKQDKPKSKSCKIIRNMLEKEIHTIRDTRIAALDTTDGETGNVTLGQLDREFTFNDVKNRIDFFDCSANGKDNEPQLEEIFKWLNKVA